jgi:murein DD-endopeptidase MepM/ murein hydrolase activator NlpD
MAYSRIHRAALGATPVDTDPPTPGKPQPPIYPLQIGDHGGWLEVRASPADGACGVHGYPCKHPGVDVAGAAGTPVVAPESGAVVAAGDGSAAPFVGYGPWFIVIQGADSGEFHLLGHLDPTASAMAPISAQVMAGDQVGITSSANHTHWEVRDAMVPPSGEDNFSNNQDPIAWLSGTSNLGTVLLVGGAALFLWFLLGG